MIEHIITALLVVLIVASAVVSYRNHRHNSAADRARRKALWSFAHRAGLVFDASRHAPPPLAGSLHFFRAGRENATRHTMTKSVRVRDRAYTLIAGDLEFELRVGSDARDFRCSYALARREGWSYPATRITTRAFFDDYAGDTRMHDVRTESAAFTARVALRTFDRRFAYDLAHPRMCEAIAARMDSGPCPLIELDHDALLIAGLVPESAKEHRADPRSPRDHRWSAEQFEEAIAALIALLELFPEHLARDLDAQNTA